MEKTMSKEELMKMVASELRMSNDDDLCDNESDMIVMLQDEYNLTEKEATELVEKSWKFI
jgi:nucleoid DNA-binding protein